MLIEIAERLKPFSHRPGIAFMLPETSLRITIWPARVTVDDLSSSQPQSISDFSIDINGPLKDFTVVQDLEKRIIRVWGHSPTGYLRYQISKDGLTIEKAPKSSGLHEGQKISLPIEQPKTGYDAQIERLSLGSHKKQDWTGIQLRLDLTEILPIWFRLGQLVPKEAILAKGGTTELLKPIETAIANADTLSISEAFRDLFLAGFDAGLVPRLLDTSYQGFNLPEITQGSPLTLLTEGSSLIRNMFIQQGHNSIAILPTLPPEFHCGRICGIKCSDVGHLDIEWTKKMIRRMVFSAHKAADVRFVFPKEIKRFRLQVGKHSRMVTSTETVSVEPKTILYFDRFEK